MSSKGADILRAKRAAEDEEEEKAERAKDENR